MSRDPRFAELDALIAQKKRGQGLKPGPKGKQPRAKLVWMRSQQAERRRA